MSFATEVMKHQMLAAGYKLTSLSFDLSVDVGDKQVISHPLVWYPTV